MYKRNGQCGMRRLVSLAVSVEAEVALQMGTVSVLNDNLYRKHL